MNNNIKELIEHFIDINEENEHLTKKFTNKNFVKSIQDMFKNNFKNIITIDVNIPYSDIKKDEYYQYLMINIAGQLIEQYIAKFIEVEFKKRFDCKPTINLTQRGKVHDIKTTFKGKKGIPYDQYFEVKSYNDKFGNITLSKNQRKEDHIKNPVYILCNYKITNNVVENTQIYFLLGSMFDIKDKSSKEYTELFDENGMLKSKHFSVKFNKFCMFDINNK